MERTYLSLGSIILILLTSCIPIIIRLLYHKIKLIGQMREYTSLRLHQLELKVEDAVTLTIESTDGKPNLVAKLGVEIPKYAQYVVKHIENGLQVTWHGYAALTIHHRQKKDNFYTVRWEGHPRSTIVLEDHVHLLNYHWYGGGQTYKQSYPIEKWNTRVGPMVTGIPQGTIFSADYFGNVQERLWLSSSGAAVSVDRDIPLFVSVNKDFDNRIRLVSQYASPFQTSTTDKPVLKYTICQAEDIVQAYRHCAEEFFPHPSAAPENSLFHHPGWTVHPSSDTTELSLADIVSTADLLKDYGFQSSQFHLKGKWSTNTGDWEFDPQRFPENSARKMLRQWQDSGISLMVDFHPFVSLQCDAYTMQAPGTLLKNCITHPPSHIEVEKEPVALLDVLDDRTVAKLRRAKYLLTAQCEVIGFCFTGVEAGYLSTEPNAFNKIFIRKLFDGDQKPRINTLMMADGMQDLPAFVCLGPKSPRWDNYNGLQTIIPHVLTVGSMGYPFINPGVIGGEVNSSLVQEELYVRWVQVVTLMPHMEFGIPPWDYSPRVIDIVKAMCGLRMHHADKFTQLVEEAVQTGTPIIRPLWWVAPRDQVALTTSTQYMVGEDIIVAPVLHPGARTRDIYLPAGIWRDELHSNNNFIKGPRWLRDFPAALEELPHFTKMD